MASARPPPGIGSVQTFKVVLLGEVGVGKSALFLRMKDGVFRDNRQPTVGIESCTKPVSVDDVVVALQTFKTGKPPSERGEDGALKGNFGFIWKISEKVWDTAGVERYRTLTRNYYRNTQASILVYSLDNPASLVYLSKWIEDTHNFAPNAMLFLFGNKSDLEKSVNLESVEEFAAAHDVENAFFVSAKTGGGLEEALSAIGQKLVNSSNGRSLMQDSIFDDSINMHTKSSQFSRNSSCEC